MKKPREILVPTDFSEPSRAAEAYARVLAESLGGRLHVLHVIPDPLDMGWGIDVAYLPQMLERAEEQVRSQLKEALTPDEQRRFDVRFAIETGTPALRIVAYAERERIDIIVMGTHGRGALEKMWIGSVTERVIQRSVWPVLVVREQRPEERRVDIEEARPELVQNTSWRAREE
jgi:nucleotide-binding universal stress UspA family protein